MFANLALTKVVACMRGVTFRPQRCLLIPLILGCLFLGTNSNADASHGRPGTHRLRPPVSPSGQPLLGFTGQMQYGYGLVVQSVNQGSLAEYIGLEPGDVITVINGQQVPSLDMYYSLLRNSGGFIQMEVIDCRSGNPAGIDFYLDNGTSGQVAAAPVASANPRMPGRGAGPVGGRNSAQSGATRPTNGNRPAVQQGNARQPVVRRY